MVRIGTIGLVGICEEDIHYIQDILERKGSYPKSLFKPYRDGEDPTKNRGNNSTGKKYGYTKGRRSKEARRY